MVASLSRNANANTNLKHYYINLIPKIYPPNDSGNITYYHIYCHHYYCDSNKQFAHVSFLCESSILYVNQYYNVFFTILLQFGCKYFSVLFIRLLVSALLHIKYSVVLLVYVCYFCKLFNT